MTRITFRYDLAPDSALHVVTSPELKGFRATGATRREAMAEALKILEMIRQDESGDDTVLKAVEFEAA